MANLTSDLQLDTHLKPLKSGEELSSLELSSKSNGARITGDLEVTGEIKGGSFADSNFIHIINTGWVGSTGKIYMPLNGYVIEKSNLYAVSSVGISVVTSADAVVFGASTPALET